MKKLVTLLILIIATTWISGQGVWRQMGNMPFPVSGGAAIFNNDLKTPKFYIIGGYSDSLQSAVNWIQEYDPVNNVWKMVGAMKEARYLLSADFYKGSSIYFGGNQPNSTIKESLEGFEFTNINPEIKDSKPTFARNFSTGHVVGDNLYIIGGNSSISGVTLPYIVEYNLVTKEESIKFDLGSADKPEAHMTAIVKKDIFIFGGIYNGIKNWIRKFNITGRKYYYLDAALLSPRAGGAAVYNEFLGRVLIIGGYDETNSALSTVESVEIGNNDSIKVKQYVPMNFARKNFMAVNYQNKIAVFGGRDAKGEVVRAVEIYFDTTMVSNRDRIEELPTSIKLHQNYPNPFNPSTTISFDINKEQKINIEIYNYLGERIKDLYSGVSPSGSHSLYWDGTDNLGNKVSSGIYFVKLSSENFSVTKKMALLK